MAIIIETCPKCGHDLHDVMLASNPPIPQKECFNCGWSWIGEPEQVIRVPFGGNSLNVDSTWLNGNTDYEFVKPADSIEPIILNNFEELDESLLKKYLTEQPLRIFADHKDDYPSCCDGCSNNPKNGGSGICNCTLPYMQNPINYSVPVEDSCMANGTKGYVYTTSTKLPDKSADVNEAIKRIEKYLR